MLFVRMLLLFAISISPHVSAEALPEHSPEIKTAASGNTLSWQLPSRSQSRLDRLAQDDLKKREELAFPVTVTILSLGRSVDGLEEIKDRMVDIRITNPNPYPIFFQGRRYKGNKTITPRWRTLKDEKWTSAGWDWCSSGIRDWDIEPNGSVDVMVYLHPELNAQQILGRFYKTDRPSIQSDCLLYEKK